MGSRYAVGVTISSAHDLKNVNWHCVDLKPYAVVWVDGVAKCSTKVALDGDTNPVWDDEKLTIPLPPDRRLDDLTFHLDLVHARSDGQDQTKLLIGSAKPPLIDVTDEVGIGGKLTRSLKLKRPSGRSHGRLDVKVVVKDPARYNYDRYAPTYGQPSLARSRYYGATLPQYGYGKPYAVATAAPAGYPYSAPHAPLAYGQGYGQSSYGESAYRIEDNAAERVEDDLAYQDGGYDDF